MQRERSSLERPGARPLRFPSMESPEHERDAIEGYMAWQAPDEKMVHLEKVTSERVMGRDRDVWDVHTDKERWWVITEPTNLYSQAQFPSMDVALSFHIGVTLRVEERDRRYAPADDHIALFAEAWRKLEQAGEALNTADEAEEFQSVGMHCRESMIAFMRAASEAVPLPPGVEAPKGADVKGWAEVLGDVVTPGGSNKEHRSYLKMLAGKTWELVNWLTHYAGATGYHAGISHRATEHALLNWSFAIMVHGKGGPPRCPVCGSYRLRRDFESEGLSAIEVTMCGKCGWEGDGVPVEEEAEPPPHDPPEGECTFVDVPLRPPFKRPG
jgi:predicted RNA-binding Zn-ribbon protein involved in translation (DUF1610 family)